MRFTGMSVTRIIYPFMFKTLLFSFGVIVLVPFASLAAVDEAPIVILISVDGLPSDYFEDRRADIPTLRRMAAKGARAKRMLSVFPTVTWPNHTSMITGVMPARHGVVGNRFFDRAAGRDVELLWDPELDKEAIVLRPTVYDVAHRAGLKTAGVAWPASRNAKHLDWQVPCVIEPALLTRYTTPSLLAEVTRLGIPLERKPDWSKVEVGGKLLWDWMHTRIAQHILRTHRPNLLLVHLDGVDSLEHRNGRNSPESYWAANIADHHINELMETVRMAGLAARTTFLVVSDHGFRNYTKQINLNATLRDMGLIKTAGNRIVERSVHLLAMSGGAGLYILDEAKRATLTRDLLVRLPSIEGVEAVLDGNAIVAQGLPVPGPHSRASGYHALRRRGLYVFRPNPHVGCDHAQRGHKGRSRPPAIRRQDARILYCVRGRDQARHYSR